MEIAQTLAQPYLHVRAPMKPIASKVWAVSVMGAPTVHKDVLKMLSFQSQQ